MIAGESIYVILVERFETVSKVVKTDSLSALAILTNDGGSWRPRHLSMYARQSVAAGDTLLCHHPNLTLSLITPEFGNFNSKKSHWLLSDQFGMIDPPQTYRVVPLGSKGCP